MKPFTSKHCTQYLTKSSPLNQGLIFKDQDPNDPKVQESIRRMIDKREKTMGKSEPTVYEQASKKLSSKLKEQYRPKTGPTGIAPDKRQFEPTNYGFKRGSEADEATLKRMSSTKYKK